VRKVGLEPCGSLSDHAGELENSRVFGVLWLRTMTRIALAGAQLWDFCGVGSLSA